jgi:peroxiredoxin
MTKTEDKFMANTKLHQPQTGELAPDFSLSATDGNWITLSNYPKPVALTFFRHLA